MTMPQPPLEKSHLPVGHAHGLFAFLVIVPMLLPSIFGWGKKKKPPSNVPPPPEYLAPLGSIPPTDLLTLPSWVSADGTLDQVMQQTNRGTPPTYRPTLIIGAGEIGALVLDQIARTLEQREAAQGRSPQTVRLLQIDVYPQARRRPPPPHHAYLRDDQRIRLEPQFAEVDEMIRRKPDRYFHLAWWEGNDAEAYGRAGGRMALFYDLQHGTEGSQLWRKLADLFAELVNPAVWIVASTFDNSGSGMAVDLARLTRRISDQTATLILMLPGSTWGRLDHREQLARSVATLREIQRMMPNTDMPFVYNPWAGQEALDHWSRNAATVEHLFLVDPSYHPDPALTPTGDLQHEAATVIAESLLTLIEPAPYERFQQILTTSNDVFRIVNQGHHTLVGALGCVVVSTPVAALRAAIEARAIHELLFDTTVGLVPCGAFDQQGAWERSPLQADPSEQAGVEAALQFLGRLGVEPLQLPTYSAEQARTLRQRFLPQLQTTIDSCLNGSGAGAIFERRTGGLTRACVCARTVAERLARSRQPDVRQCAHWATELQTALEAWVQILIGPLNEDAPPELTPIEQITAAVYARHRAELGALRNSLVRFTPLDDRLDLPFYKEWLGAKREPLARVLRRIGWWSLPPEGSAPWRIQLVVLPPGIESATLATVRVASYRHDQPTELCAALAELLVPFSRTVAELVRVERVFGGGVSPDHLLRQAEPRLTVNNAEVGSIIGQFALHRPTLVTTPPGEAGTAFADRLRGSGSAPDLIAYPSSDEDSYRVLRLIYPLPLVATSAFDEKAWAEYYGDPLHHVFPEEQRAVRLEASQSLLHQGIRLSARAVQALSGHSTDLLSLVILCWIYKLFLISPRGAFNLTLGDQRFPEPLLEGTTKNWWEAPFAAVGSAFQIDELNVLAPFGRTNQGEAVRRIEEALRQRRAEFDDRAQRVEYLENFRRAKVAELEAVAASQADRELQRGEDEGQQQARDLIALLVALVEHERRR